MGGRKTAYATIYNWFIHKGDYVSDSSLIPNLGMSLFADLSIVECFSLPQWNNHGYDIAKWFAAKFTHISPVWLQLKRK